MGYGAGDDGEQKKHIWVASEEARAAETEAAAEAFTSAKADGSEDKDLVKTSLPSSKRYVSSCMSGVGEKSSHDCMYAWDVCARG